MIREAHWKGCLLGCLLGKELRSRYLDGERHQRPFHFEESKRASVFLSWPRGMPEKLGKAPHFHVDRNPNDLESTYHTES